MTISFKEMLHSLRQPVPLLIDTDNAMGAPVADVDDGVALAAALASPEVEVVAVCGCAGNCSAAFSARNSWKLLHVCGRDEIPVGVGQEHPLCCEHRNRDGHHAFLARHAQGAGRELWPGSLDSPELAASAGVHDVSGTTGASPIAMPDALVDASPTVFPDAAETIIRAAREAAGELVVLSLGSLTNLAVALRQAPEVARHIRMVIHMGGQFLPWKPGQMRAEFATPDIPESVWDKALRFNTWYDPEASAQVFSSGIPVVVVPVNVTSHGFLRPGHMELLGKVGSKRLDWLVQQVRPWVTWSEQVRGLPGAHMHDPMALALLCRPDLFQLQPMQVDVPALLREAPVFLGPVPHEEALDREATTCCPIHSAIQVNASGFEQLLVQRLAAF